MRQHRLNVILLGMLVLILVALVAWYIWFFAFRNADETGTTNQANNMNAENVVNTSNTTNATNNTTNSSNTTNTTNNTTNTTKGTSSTSGNITVTSPVASAVIGESFTVAGFAKVYENVVQVRVKDDKGVVLLETFVTTDASDIGKTGAYKKTLTLEQEPTDTKGKIEFFTSDAATGEEQDKVIVSVKF